MMINKVFLIAGVATLALSMPAQARPDREDRDQRAERSERQAQRAERQQQRSQRVERRAQQRVERQQPRAERAERRVQRAERQQPRIERRAQRVEQRAQRVERPQPRAERRVERAERQQPRIERRAQQVEQRAQRVDRRAQQVEQRAQRLERQQPRLERRAQRIEQRQQRIESVQPLIERRTERVEQRQQRAAIQQARREERRIERLQRPVEVRRALVERDWQGNVEQRFARWNNDDRRERRKAFRQAVATSSVIGQQINPVWFDDYVPLRYRTSYYDTPNYFYRYDWDDGYLYRVNRGNNLIAALIPILGGAYSIGNMYPVTYNSYYGNPYHYAGYSPYYNVPLGYRSFYYDTPDYYYRYGGGAIYQIDPTTQLITAIVALLTGANFNIGQQMPFGYDAYNVPYAYRDRYYDTHDAWYRYDDGFIYQVDPRSRLVMQAYPASYSPFSVGYAVPDYYWDGYYADYNVPFGYRDLYYDTSDYNYRFYNGGIYQVDPTTRLVQALVALVTGTQLGVGQQLPVGYDVYNVPWQYRTTYYDRHDAWYRYNDGYIYRVDPTTRLIQEVIRAIA